MTRDELMTRALALPPKDRSMLLDKCIAAVTGKVLEHFQFVVRVDSVGRKVAAVPNRETAGQVLFSIGINSSKVMPAESFLSEGATR